MKKTTILFACLVLMAGIFTSCSSKKERTCNLFAASAGGPQENMTITFTAEQTGDGTISWVTYTTSSGVVTVQNPQLPWTITA